MNMWIRSVFAVSAFSLTGLSPPPATAQGADLLSDPTVIALAEEALIADLMLRSCAGIVGSDTGAAEVRALADELARQFGHTPETAAARLSRAAARCSCCIRIWSCSLPGSACHWGVRMMRVSGVPASMDL